MKEQGTDTPPLFDPRKFNNIQQQVHNEVISHVLIEGVWYEIVEGSFKLYKTGGDRPVPYIQFDLNMDIVTGSLPSMVGKRIQVFPANIAGWAYTPSEGK